VAQGYHLHFEVRQGINDYDNTRNPELWLMPGSDEHGRSHGAIAGVVINKHGILVDIPSVVITRLDSEGKAIKTYYVGTYANKDLKGDDLWNENFALGDLPAGRYRVSFVIRSLHVYEVEVKPGMVTMITYDAREK
jgi:hypothetical protein